MENSNVEEYYKREEERPSQRVALRALFGILNLIFIAIGVFIIVLVSRVKHEGWYDAIRDTSYESRLDTPLLIGEIVGGCVIGVGLVGLIGSFTRSRVLLVLYNCVVMALLTVFLIVAGFAMSFRNKAKDLQGGKRAEDEEKYAKYFNQGYCYSEGVYLCNDAKASELVQAYDPQMSPMLVGTLQTALSDVVGLNGLCARAEILTRIPQVKTACDVCNQAKIFAKYSNLLEWANSKCPRSRTTMDWCANFFAKRGDQSDFENSPFGECRPVILDTVVDLLTKIMTVAFIVAGICFFIIILACLARRKSSHM
uniref:Uncharacterized protein AlNc14C5G777 n=1 Tax=Albugo laibachii Nc14 TaxID=890382 RepID=F0W0Z7_9STRA|nr:conserved hypothetical protein [Albugo laibachii Nc14]|eukprot:CCA14721.1 conserved hypothetical protein [Albugo laibachii Nc14]